jgi:hypothetical protein
MRVASTLPAVPLVPVAEMHVPGVMSLSLTDTVAVMAVLAVTSTVVCPVVPWTSRSGPRMLAMVPEAAGPKVVAAGERPVAAAAAVVGLAAPEAVLAAVVLVVAAAVVVVVALAAAGDPPQAAAMSATTTRVPTTAPGWRALLSGKAILFILSSYFQAGQVQSLRNASMGANRAARDAG